MSEVAAVTERGDRENLGVLNALAPAIVLGYRSLLKSPAAQADFDTLVDLVRHRRRT